MQNNIEQMVNDKIFKEYAVKIQVYLRFTNLKGTTYNPNYNTGKTIELANPITVKGIVRQLTGNSLIVRELGLLETGAVEVIMKDRDIEAVALSEQVQINGVIYSVKNQALGNQVQVFSRPFGYSKIIMFRLR